MIDFEVRPAPSACRSSNQALLASPGFGQVFTDHMVTLRWSAERGWHDGRLEPYGPFTLTRPPRCSTTDRRSSRA